MQEETGKIKNEVGAQDAKLDKGKLRLSLVPVTLIRAVAEVREYGVKKYMDPDNWKKVEYGRYIDAAYRHWLKVVDDPKSIDEESGLPHLWHVACNIAFIIDILGDPRTKGRDAME